MFNTISFYIFKKFLTAFLLTFLILSAILFIGDFVEQFRKSAGKEVPIKVIIQLAAFNFPSLISYTLPITSFLGSIFAFLILIRNSEALVISSVGISSFKTIFPAIILYLFIGIIFIVLANPLISFFDDRYTNLKYKYIDRVDKFASITKNGLWLKQENIETGFSSVLYAKNIKKQGQELFDFMLLEYDNNGSFNGRIDGKKAYLRNGYWELYDIQISPRYKDAKFLNYLKYSTNIKSNDITDSLSAPSSIPIWRLLKFISFLEDLGYSAVDFKMHLYGLLMLPLFIASLSILASSIVQGLKQNDKFTKTIIISLILIFFLYFISNLLDALGSTSQIHPIFAKLCMPVITIIISFFLYQYDEIKRRKLIR